MQMPCNSCRVALMDAGTLAHIVLMDPPGGVDWSKWDKARRLMVLQETCCSVSTDTYDNLIRRWLRAQDCLIGSKTPWSERFKFYRLSRDLQPCDLLRYHLHRFRQPSTVEPLAPEPTVEPPQVSRDLQALHLALHATATIMCRQSTLSLLAENSWSQLPL